MEVHSPVGFDEKLPLRCLLEAVNRFGNVTKFVAYIPKPSDPKAEKAVSNLKEIIVSYGKEFEVLELSADPGDLPRNVALVSARLIRSLKVDDVTLCLNAGMRQLIVAALLAITTLDPDDWGKAFVYLGSEGDPTKGALFNLAYLLGELKPLCGYGDLERAIYAIVKEGPMRKAEVLRKLRDMGFEFSKQYVYEVIRRMVDKGSLEIIRQNGKELVALKGHAARE